MWFSIWWQVPFGFDRSMEHSLWDKHTNCFSFARPSPSKRLPKSIHLFPRLKTKTLLLARFLRQHAKASASIPLPRPFLFIHVLNMYNTQICNQQVSQWHDTCMSQCQAVMPPNAYLISIKLPPPQFLRSKPRSPAAIVIQQKCLTYIVTTGMQTQRLHSKFPLTWK